MSDFANFVAKRNLWSKVFSDVCFLIWFINSVSNNFDAYDFFVWVLYFKKQNGNFTLLLPIEND